MLPNFLIIGAPRSGTTHLYHGLRQHPEVFMSDFKEPMFFAYEGNPQPSVIHDRESYEALFQGADVQQARGEASTLYLYSPVAPENIQRTIPDARLIAILRNPVDRAFSQYTFQRFLKTEPLETFEEALDAESERLQDPIPFHLYRPVGLYSAQIKRYQDRFPSHQLLWLLQDELEREPERIFQQIFRHISVNPDFAPDLRHRTNASGVPEHESLFRAIKSAGRAIKRFLPEKVAVSLSGTAHETLLQRRQMRPETKRALLAYFHEDIEATAELIGRDLSHWLQE